VDSEAEPSREERLWQMIEFLLDQIVELKEENHSMQVQLDYYDEKLGELTL
jgi:hypothetical protein